MKKAKDSRKGVSTTVIVAAIILIIIVVIAGVYIYQVYVVPEEEVELKETLIMGTTDAVESAVDPAQAYDFFGWEIIQNTGCTLVDIDPGSGAGAEDFTPNSSNHKLQSSASLPTLLPLYYS